MTTNADALSIPMPVGLLPDQAAFERAGFRFPVMMRGSVSQQGVLPKGWWFTTTGHCWVQVFDTKSRERAVLFDSSGDEPFGILLSRFRVLPVFSESGRVIASIVADANAFPLYRWDIEGNGAGDPQYVASHKAAFDAAKRVIAEKYPDHRDPLAYWD